MAVRCQPASGLTRKVTGMIKRTAFAATAAVAAVCLLPLAAQAHCRYFPPPIASNFDAYFYQSRGGIGRPGYPAGIYGRRHARVQAAEPYPHACGSDRTWNGKRCVER